MGVFILLLLAGVLLYAFGRAFAVEARRTNWSLLEALIMVNILGHVIAYPVSMMLLDDYFRDQREYYALLAAVAGLFVSLCMAGGAIWVFRRLQVAGETRFWRRIGWMILGMLLFPSMVLFPWNLLVGWFVWLPLRSLHQQTEAKLPPHPLKPEGRHLERHRLRQHASAANQVE